MVGMTNADLGQAGTEASPIGSAAISAGNLQALAALDRASLRQWWRELFGGAMPPRASQAWLIYALAYRMQENAYGGLSAATRTRLRNIAQQLAPATSSPKSTVARIPPGTRLIRQWRAQRHEVTVLETGYTYRGSRYASLSANARLTRVRTAWGRDSLDCSRGPLRAQEAVWPNKSTERTHPSTLQPTVARGESVRLYQT